MSPYIETKSSVCSWSSLAAELPANSRVAYDFKLPGANDDFGRSERIPQPFRLASIRDEVVAYHSARGYQVERLETGVELSRRLVPSVELLNPVLFEEDALVQLSIAARG